MIEDRMDQQALQDQVVHLVHKGKLDSEVHKVLLVSMDQTGLMD